MTQPHNEKNFYQALQAVVDGYSYDPGDSDLDDEQTIHVRLTLGDYRRIRQAVAGQNTKD